MACLNDEEAAALVGTAHDLGMDVLVEVNDAEELKRAIPLGTRLIGINKRNLKTFQVSFETAIRLAPASRRTGSPPPRAVWAATPTLHDSAKTACS
jgi:indole-3-glycerol phosphate synthase